MPEFTLQISGSSSISKAAERADVKLSAADNGPNKQTVAENVLKTAQAIEILIADIIQGQAPHSGLTTSTPSPSSPIAQWNKTALSATSYTQYVSQDEPDRKTFEASIDFSISFRDFNRLGAFSVPLTALDYCEIKSIEWKLLDSTRQHYSRELRTQAAQDALANARDYCKVLCPDDRGLRIVPAKLTLRSDESGHDTYGIIQRAAVKRMAREPANDSNTLSFTPEECEMRVDIDVHFVVETQGVDINTLTIDD